MACNYNYLFWGWGCGYWLWKLIKHHLLLWLCLKQQQQQQQHSYAFSGSLRFLFYKTWLFIKDYPAPAKKRKRVMSDAKTISLCSPHLTSARRKFLLVICLLNNLVNKNKKDFIQWLAFSCASLDLRPGASPSIQTEHGPGECLFEVTGLHPAGSAGLVSYFHPK